MSASGSNCLCFHLAPGGSRAAAFNFLRGNCLPFHQRQSCCSAAAISSEPAIVLCAAATTVLNDSLTSATTGISDMLCASATTASAIQRRWRFQQQREQQQLLQLCRSDGIFNNGVATIHRQHPRHRFPAAAVFSPLLSATGSAAVAPVAVVSSGRSASRKAAGANTLRSSQILSLAES